MTGVPGSEHRGGPHPAGEPDPFEPGLDHLIAALTAGGHPHERAGRDAALAAFRAASQEQPRRAGLAAGLRRMRGSGSRGPVAAPRRARARLTVRLAAVSAAGFAAVIGLTAAAYAQALPAPVQKIAYSVLAPLGVPNSAATAAHPNTATASTRPVLPSAAATASGAAASGAASPGGGACPCPASPSPTATTLGADHYAITVTAARTQVRAGSPDLFTGRVRDPGHRVSGVRVRLLKHVAGVPGWRLVTSGVTGIHGRIRLQAPQVATNATFRLAGPDGASSASVTVTVTPVVRLRLVSGPDKDRLIVAAAGATAGESASLMKLDNGTWKTVRSKPLGPKLRATFTLPADPAAGYLYRVGLPASATAGAVVSNRVWIPRLAGTGAKASQPTQSATPVPTATETATSTPAPGPTASPTRPGPGVRRAALGARSPGQRIATAGRGDGGRS